MRAGTPDGRRDCQRPPCDLPACQPPAIRADGSVAAVGSGSREVPRKGSSGARGQVQGKSGEEVGTHRRRGGSVALATMEVTHGVGQRKPVGDVGAVASLVGSLSGEVSAMILRRENAVGRAGWRRAGLVFHFWRRDPGGHRAGRVASGEAGESGGLPGRPLIGGAVARAANKPPEDRLVGSGDARGESLTIGRGRSR